MRLIAYLLMVDVLDVMLGPMVMCTKTLVSFSANLASSSPFHLYVKTALILPVIKANVTIKSTGNFLLLLLQCEKLPMRVLLNR